MSSIDLAREPDIELGGILISPPTREIVAGGVRETLEPRVMQVLVALARRRGSVVSRAELKEICWGGRILGEDVIYRCIAVLRRIAGRHGGFALGTVARVGYRLVEAPDAAGRRPGVPESAPAILTEGAATDLYLRAKADCSQRTPEGLKRSISQFGALIASDPCFVPAFTGLADAHILACDYAAVPPWMAFPRAQAAATAALALDPHNAEANRALGFVDYWARQNLHGARRHFARALAADPQSPQTHMWLGNILSAAGDGLNAVRALRTARLLEPDSKAVQMDYAYALWLAEADDAQVEELRSLADEGAPNLVHKLLAHIALAQGDLAEFLSRSDQLASLTGDETVATYVASERAALARGGIGALLDLLTAEPPPRALIDCETLERHATFVSMAGRREQLLDLLSQAKAAGEVWTSWRPGQPRCSRWRGDIEVTRALSEISGR